MIAETAAALVILNELAKLYKSFTQKDLPPHLEQRLTLANEDGQSLKAILEAIDVFSRAFGSESQRRAQAGHDEAAEKREAQKREWFRRGGVGILVFAFLSLSACASWPRSVPSVAVSLTEPTVAAPFAQIAIEWPEHVQEYDVVTITVEGRVISYAPANPTTPE